MSSVFSPANVVDEEEFSSRSKISKVEDYKLPQISSDGRYNKYFSPKSTLCPHMTGHNEFMMEFTKMIVDSSAIEGALGGEDLNSVRMQSEASEYPTLLKGFFNVECPSFNTTAHVFTRSGSHFDEFLRATSVASFDDRFPDKFNFSSDEIVFVVKRFDYVNVYHTTAEWYNAYIAARRLDVSPTRIHILVVDAHPDGLLDSTWKTLFGGFSRIGDYRSSHFSNKPNLLRSFGQKNFAPNHQQSRLIYLNRAAWSPPGYMSPYFVELGAEELYLADEYSNYFLARHGFFNSAIRMLNSDEHPSNSSCRPKALLIFRHNYFSHPRQKKVLRKIANEQEVLYWLQEAKIVINDRTLPLLQSIVGVQLDSLSMNEQLQLLNSADILIGVHGAGLTHAFHLPPMSAVIEFFPTYSVSILKFFEAISRWRKHVYVSWDKFTPDLQLNDETSRIPPKVAVELVSNAISRFRRRFSTCP